MLFIYSNILEFMVALSTFPPQMKTTIAKINLKGYLFTLIAASVLLYANTFKNDFVLDDDVVFLKNKFVQEGVGGIGDILSHGFLYGFNQRNDQSYRPIVLIDFAIDKSLFGNNSTALHLLNVLYFAFLVCLVFLLMHKMLPENSTWLAFWIALLFAFHPIHTEVVANIKGRDELLHAIFACLTLFYGFHYFDSRNQKPLYLSLLFFFLALLSKEMAVTLIALLPLCMYFFREVEVQKLFKFILPYGLVLLGYLLIRQLVLDDITFEEDMTVINNTLAGASNVADRIATNLLIFGNYIRLLFFPHPLTWDYSYPHFPIVGFLYPRVILIVALLVTATIFAFKGLKTKNYYAWAFFFFIISFSVVSNFLILIGATLGERFLFFPSIAFCFLMVFLIKDLDQKIFSKRRKYTLPVIFMLLLLLPMGAKTIDRNSDWRSNETLFISGVEATPNNSRAVSALASIYRVRGENATNLRDKEFNLNKAKEYYLESIRLYDGNADAFYNLGVSYTNLGLPEKARLSYVRVLEIAPNHVNALNNLGVIYFQQTNLNSAEELFLKALNVQPNFQNAYANLGAVYHNRGEKEKARQYYQKALQLNPGDVNTRNNLNLLQN